MNCFVLFLFLFISMIEGKSHHQLERSPGQSRLKRWYGRYPKCKWRRCYDDYDNDDDDNYDNDDDNDEEGGFDYRLLRRRKHRHMIGGRHSEELYNTRSEDFVRMNKDDLVRLLMQQALDHAHINNAMLRRHQADQAWREKLKIDIENRDRENEIMTKKLYEAVDNAPTHRLQSYGGDLNDQNINMANMGVVNGVLPVPEQNVKRNLDGLGRR